jgi:GAF domain-containing protein
MSGPGSSILGEVAERLAPQRDAIVEAWARRLGSVAEGPLEEMHAYCGRTLDRLLTAFRTGALQAFVQEEGEAAAEAARNGASLLPLALATRTLDRCLVPVLLKDLPDPKVLAEALLALDEFSDLRLEGLLKAQEEESARRLVEAQEQAALAEERSREKERANEALRKLTEASRRRALRIELLNSVAHKIVPILDSERLTEEAAQTIQARMNYMYVAVVILDNEGVLVGRWAGRAGIGRRSAGRAQGPAGGVIGRALRKRSPQVVDDVERDPDYHKDVPGAVSEMVIPLLDGGEAVGALDFQSDRPADFDLDDVASGETLADFLVVALRNARLLGEARTSSS